VSTSYAEAGVDIRLAESLLDAAQSSIKSTQTPGVLQLAKGFAGLFAPDLSQTKNPVFAATTDGVGTKTKVALMANRHRGIGEDLVSHCINDLLCVGATPLFFQDYFACAQFDQAIFSQIMSGMASACRGAGIAILGGETAQMPGVYHDNDYDLAGTMVGVVDRDKVLTGKTIQPGDVLLGLASKGLHTNGYSLARKVLFEEAKLGIHDAPPELNGETLADALLKPHASYLAALREPLSKALIKGLAHITGGGIPDNLHRILPEGCRAVIDSSAWEIPGIFRLIQKTGNIPREEMLRAFNMGIGMIAVVAVADAPRMQETLRAHKEQSYVIGSVTSGPRAVAVV
jgi:phosphoribosylformylglycinamidine cyclo-ligase